MKKVVFVGIALVTVGSLAACGSTTVSSNGGDVPAAPSQNSESSPSSVPDTVPLGTAVVTNGIHIGISKPTKFNPSEYAAGTLPHSQNFQFLIKVTNSSSTKFDPSDTEVTVAAGGGECSQVFDDGLDNTPTTTLLPGRSVMWPEAYSCKGKSGSDLTLDLTVYGSGSTESLSVTFVGVTP